MHRESGYANRELIGLRQTADGAMEEWPVESLLLLKGASNFAPGSEPLAAMAKGSGI